MDFIANIRHYCFMQLTSTEQCICSTANPWEQVTISYWNRWWNYNSVLLLILGGSWTTKDPSCGVVAFFQPTVSRSWDLKPDLISWKSWASSGTSFWFSFHSTSICIFQQRQDLSKECDCSLLLVKCLKKICNLNCCRAHQYEIGLVEGNKI